MPNWHKHENFFITSRPGHDFFVFTPYAYMSSSSYLVGARGLSFCTSIHLRHINYETVYALAEKFESLFCYAVLVSFLV